MNEKIEDVEARIKELEQVKIALKEKQLTEERKAERLKLLNHPFVKVLGHTLREANWITFEQIRKAQYGELEKQKQEAISDLTKKVSWILKSSGESITESKLTDMIEKILGGENKTETKGMVI
jgi:hypothetical protein